MKYCTTYSKIQKPRSVIQMLTLKYIGVQYKKILLSDEAS